MFKTAHIYFSDVCTGLMSVRCHILSICHYREMEERKEHEGPTYNWKCVTDEFIQACDQLELGELLHDSS